MTTYTAIDGLTVTPKTRADLMQHPEFANLGADTSGNPCVWRNTYHHCISWSDDWSCQADDECPECGSSCSPRASLWLVRSTFNSVDATTRLWASLPEACGLEALGITSDDILQSRRENATILAALRYWQDAPGKADAFVEIASDGGNFTPLTADEIDDLCERLNT